MISPEYIAGVIDGEGYLGLLPVRTKHTTNPCFEPVVKIGMTGIAAWNMFEEIKAEYTGHLRTDTHRVTKGRRAIHVITIKNKKNVLRLMQDILPYLRVKKDQADVLIAFCELPMAHPHHFSFDPTVIDKKVEYFNRLKELKLPEPLPSHLQRLTE